MDEQPAHPVFSPMEVPFHYGKANHFRVIHVDGAHGGLSPTGRHITMTLYSERTPIPREETYTISPEQPPHVSTTNPPLKLEGVFREVEVSAVMDVEVAQSLHVWLGKKIEDAKAVKAAITKMQQARNE